MASRFARRRGLRALGAALLALAVTPQVADAAGQSTGHPATVRPASATTGTQAVTLITGDRVTVRTLADGRSTATVKRPAHLTGSVQTQEIGKDLYVYPSEALPYLAAGVLDQRLFDVTRLIADGDDDAHAAGLPLIVQYGGDGAVPKSADHPAGLATRRSLSSIHGEAATATRAKAARLWRDLTPAGSLDRAEARSAALHAQQPQSRKQAASATPVFGGGVAHIWLDGKVKATLADSTAQIGAPDVWNSGVDGKGVDVAVLDTGIDADHPDLAGQIADAQSFVPGEDTVDHHGHGTHTASTVAGTGAASDGKEKGVAPGAHLLVGKVLNDEGNGDDSWIIAGMQWAAETKHAKVISMSLGSQDASDGTDPMSQALNALSASTGALFVVAAGNAGGPLIGSPGAATSALTVGAVDSGDGLADFSSWGPRSGDGGLKPELTAPGVDILAARSRYAEGSGPYATMSGTSMATPHVAGAAALVAQQHPDLTGQQIKDALVSTAHATPDIPLSRGGAGRLDTRAAVLGDIHASATAWSGLYPWPHTADQPSTQTITYTNTGADDTTLDLAARATTTDGTPVDGRIFTLSAPTVTVPAHGTASVTVTGDPDAAPYGVTDGLVEATGADGSAVAGTLIGIDREEERYDLTLRATDRAGAPVAGIAALYRTGDTQPSQVQIPDGGRLTLRLPKGEYSVVMYADLPGAGGPDDLGLGVLSAPQIDLAGDRTVDLDARRAHRVLGVTPQRTDDAMTRIEWNRVADGHSFDENVLLPIAYTSVWAQRTAKVTSGSFNFVARWRKIHPVLTATATTKPFTGEDSLELTPQVGATRLPAGTSHLGVVYAGKGTEADYAGLDAKGKAVVVTYDRTASVDDQPAADAAQAEAAVAAGARLLLVVGDSAGRLSNWFGSTDLVTDTPIEVASLRATAGAVLIKAAEHPGLQLKLTSTPASPYVYDLVDRHDGAIPATGLTYRPEQRDLARFDSRFAGRTDAPGYNGRYDMEDFDRYGAGFDTIQQLGTARTDWVTPGRGKFTWYEQSGIVDVVEERAPLADPEPGSRTADQWLSPVIHPRLGDSVLPNRQGDYFTVNVPAWGDGNARHTGYDFGDWLETPDQLHQTVALYQGDTLIASTDHQQLNTFDPANPAALPYRLVTRTSQHTVFPTSTQTSTEWGFTSGSAGSGTADLPLIQLDYGVATDLTGAAARRTTLTLNASHMPGVTGAGTVDGATLAVSYDDGSHWTGATLHRTADGAWTAQVRAPKSAHHVSLRATAKDSAGNTVDQTVLRAYGVR
ncbi:S8 family serine peptidase [Streptomyces odontomachi]|uniref:S8 family serine peptidase n=1 Tax=Streptomyces odontomachi TaxID=2944940 RepID=UPI00210E5F60|nr:S8 family serine peptidase [Streptomyces sp. ODS25]